jgi:hypothetical protein
MTASFPFGTRWLAAWNAHSPADIAALCAEDVEYEDPVRPEPLRGRAAVAEFAESLLRAFPGLRVDAQHTPYVAVADAQAILPVRIAGVMSDAHYPWELRDGLAQRFRALYDVHEIARQIGAGPPPGSGLERMGVRLQRMTARRLRRQNLRRGA